MKTEYKWQIRFYDKNGTLVEDIAYLDETSIREDLKADLKWLVDQYRYEIVNAAKWSTAAKK